MPSKACKFGMNFEEHLPLDKDLTVQEISHLCGQGQGSKKCYRYKWTAVLPLGNDLDDLRRWDWVCMSVGACL